MRWSRSISDLLYEGARPCRGLKVIVGTLNWIVNLMASQWESLRQTFLENLAAAMKVLQFTNGNIFFLISFDESVTLIMLPLCLIGVERFICIFQILMNASRESSADQTHVAIIRMDLSIAPVSVITSQLQALSTFIQTEV